MSKPTSPSTLILYFSETGNNEFIAHKLAQRLSSDLETLRPKHPNLFLLLLSSALHLPVSLFPLSCFPSSYERVILLGPIWMGKVISPLRGFLKKYGRSLKQLIFITVCGTGEKEKDGPFGYEKVFKKMRSLFAGNLSCYEISTATIAPISPSADGFIRLSDEIFDGDLQRRFEEIVEILSR
ncbi:MAG: hypothetical protein HPY78_04450 [Brevinematales bacterium]|nr:hypothetical protein [Brevinematales bacterium]